MVEPQYRLTEKILSLVEGISDLSTQIRRTSREHHLRKENRIRSIQSSLAIENNSLSLEQVTDIIQGTRVLGPPQDILEVQNTYQAYELAFGLDPYDIGDFLKAHRLLSKELVGHPGEFRYGDVGGYDGDGRVVHVGARPQFVPDLVKELFGWAKQSSLSDLVKSCIVHFELEIIHPFEDGNGRMGRLWQSLILSQSRPIFEWLSIEYVLYENQAGYYKALEMSNHQADATYFIEFMLEAILETLESVSREPTSLSPLLDSSLEGLRDKERRVFEVIRPVLLKDKEMTSSTFSELTGYSPITCRRCLSRLVEVGILVATGLTKNRVYRLVGMTERHGQ